TAAYVAPEQAQGQKVDGRTDLYALGCVLFEMLTGRQPYIGDSPVALAYKHVSEAPPLPRSLNPEIPEPLEQVVLKAMEKDPDERYATGKAFADDLRMAADGVAVAANPTQAFEATRVVPAVVAAGGNGGDDDSYTEEDYDDEWYDDEEDPEELSPQRARSSWATIGMVAAILVLIAGAAWGGMRFLNATQQVEVPDIAGKSFQDAQTL
ncbi:protein kinase domain-containing protein, partial [Stomatohabitans albus]